MKSLSLASAAILACGSLTAQTLIIPGDLDATTTGSSTSYPWNRDSATPASNDIRVQYCYDTTNIPLGMPILINQLRFRANETTSGTWTGGDYSNVEVRLGDAGVDYAAMTTTFAANWPGGVEPAPVYSGVVTLVPGGPATPGPWYVTITLPSPVLYDPASGNDLLLDIRHDGVFTGTTSGAYATDTGRMNCTRMYNISDWQSPTGSLQNNVGLCTELGYTPAMGTYANFSADRTQVGDGELVNFMDTTFTSDPGGIVLWDWDLDGDGVFGDSTAQNPSFAYGTCGANDVSLMVADASGNTSTTTKTGFIDVVAPTADFTFTRLSTVYPIPVQLDSTSTAAGPNAVYDWDLDGDGTFETLNGGPVQVAVFPTQGLFTVGMRVSNACGMDSISQFFDTRQGLCTSAPAGAAWTSGSGHTFDVNVLAPGGLTITSLDIYHDTAGVAVTIDVYTTPGTRVGNETNPGVWTLAGSGTGISGGANVATPIDISDFCLAQGSYGMVVAFTFASGRHQYSTSASTFSNSDMSITTGAVLEPIFQAIRFTPRSWSGCIYYDFGQTAGDYTQVSSGGCSSSTGSIVDSSFTGGGSNGVPTYGEPFVVSVSNAPPNEVVSAVLLGFSDLGGLPLDVVGMTGCLLHAGGPLTLAAPTDGSGVGQTPPFGIPNDPEQLGAQIFVQPIIRDVGTNPFGAVTGKAYRARIGCP